MTDYLLLAIAILLAFRLIQGGLTMGYLSAIQRILNDTREYLQRKSQ